MQFITFDYEVVVEIAPALRYKMSLEVVATVTNANTEVYHPLKGWLPAGHQDVHISALFLNNEPISLRRMIKLTDTPDLMSRLEITAKIFSSKAKVAA